MATSGGVPEIRVKLTPEGVAEVAAALRQIQLQAGAASAKTSLAMGGMNSALQNLKTLLPALGLAAAVAGVIALGRNALNSASQIYLMGQRIGASAQNFSVLAFAAKTADVSQEQLQTGLSRLVNSLRELRTGIGASVDAFDQLGLSGKDFAGLDTVQAFDLIAQRLSKITDEGKRSELTLQLFGTRGGAVLVPLLNKIATEGFGKLEEAAKRAGVLVPDAVAAAANQTKDSMALMGQRVDGLALSFLEGLLPSVQQTMDEFEKSVDGKGTATMKDFGVWSGNVLRNMINLFLVILPLGRAVFGGIADGFAALVVASQQVLKGDFSGAIQTYKDRAVEASKTLKTSWGEASAAFDNAVAHANDKAPVIEAKVRIKSAGAGGDLANVVQDAQQQLAALVKKAGDTEIKTLVEVSKRREEMVGKEVAYQKALVEARLAGSKDQINASKLITQVELNGIADRVRAATAGYTVETTLNLTKFEAASRLIDKQTGDTKRGSQLQEALFRDTVKSQIGIAQGYYGDLQKLGSEYLARYKAAQESIVALDKEIAGNRASGEKIFRDLRLGTLTEVQRQDAQINQADQEMAQLRAAVAAGDLDKARQLRGDITSIATDIARASNAPGGQAAAINLGERIFNEANQLLEVALLRQKANETSNAVTAQKGIISAQQQIDAIKKALDTLNQQEVAIKVGVKDEALQALVSQIGDFLAKNPFSIAVQPVVAATGSDSGSIPAFASGGLVPGISLHARADDKIIRATAGEFMQPVRAVSYYGSAFMESIRRLELPRYASGGPIGGGSAAGAPGSAGKMELAININRKGIGSVFGPRDTVVALADALREIEQA
jgi:hypothetical protein